MSEDNTMSAEPMDAKGLAGELRQWAPYVPSYIQGPMCRAADFLDAPPGQEQGDIGSSRDHDHSTGSSLEEWEIANAHFLTSEWNCLGDQMFHTAVRVPFGGPMVLVFAETTEDEYELARVIRAALSSAKQVVGESSRDAILNLPQQTGGGWRDISDAPRDGRSLLLHHYISAQTMTGFWNDEDGGWLMCVTGVEIGPTHFMDLPASPEVP